MVESLAASMAGLRADLSAAKMADNLVVVMVDCWAVPMVASKADL